MRRLIAALAAAVALLPLVAKADGEAGLVIQVGDQVTTYCVPFTGESINGEALLAASGLPVEWFGSGSGLLVCAIGTNGCFDPGSFDSCFCQCKGSDCTYWAFFTRAHGARWVYSSVGVGLAKAKDGEVHGWKWGKGGPSSAPAPADVTFEQICGHPPRGGAAPSPTPRSTAAPSLPSPTTAPAGTAPPTGEPGSSPTTSAGATASAAPSPPATAAITIVPQSPAPSPPSNAAAPRSGGGDSGGSGRIVAFVIVAGGLVAAIAGAVVWRRRRGD